MDKRKNEARGRRARFIISKLDRRETQGDFNLMIRLNPLFRKL